MQARQNFHFRALVLTASLLLTTAGGAAETERLRVGLVLGGGGARGAAHIGVLKELERLQIPVDAIAGTSMGAVVGGLYAAGTSLDELEEIVISLNWAEAMSDSARRRDLNFRRKQDDVRYPVDLELGIRAGAVALPLGLVQGQNLDLMLRELTADVAHVSDFDDLPIPFRAVATDIETGAAHVMAKGDLARSIRASMSVPGLMAPTNLDGKVLVDGGLVANLPIDVVRTMNVDIIIAVDVEFPLYQPDFLQSAPAIAEQVLTILMRRETLRQIENLGPDDILIRPDLGTFASTDFGNAEIAVGVGLEAVGLVEDRLRALSVSDSEFAIYRQSRKPTATVSERLEFVRFVHGGRLATEFLAARAGVYVGDPADPRLLAEAASRLLGMDTYAQVSYRIIEDDGELGVEYTATPKRWGPDFLNVGVGLQDDFDGTTAFNLSARLTRTGLNRRGAEWRTDVQLGTDLLLQSEFYQPFGPGLKYFVAPRVDWHQNNLNVFDGDQNIAQLRVAEGEIGVDLGVELGNVGEFRAGVYTGNGNARLKIGDPLLPDRKYDLGGVFALLRFDTFSAPRFPRAGVGLNLKWDTSRTALGASEDFDKLEFDVLAAWSRGKNTLNFGFNYATTFDVVNQPQEYTQLGGFLRLSGLNYGAISGPHAATGRFVYYRLLGDAPGGLFDLPVYIGGSLEAGNIWQDQSDTNFDSLIGSGSLFLAFDTFFGAVYVAAGFAEGGEQAYYLSIGSEPR